MTSDASTWKVGDLARATGISVRTLHWYEKVGLLRPRDAPAPIASIAGGHEA